MTSTSLIYTKNEKEGIKEGGRKGGREGGREGGKGTKCVKT